MQDEKGLVNTFTGSSHATRALITLVSGRNEQLTKLANFTPSKTAAIEKLLSQIISREMQGFLKQGGYDSMIKVNNPHHTELSIIGLDVLAIAAPTATSTLRILQPLLEVWLDS